MVFEKISNSDILFRRYAPKLIDGDIYEFGVYEGGTARELAKLNRTVYAFDTYQGMPGYDYDPKLDHDEPGKFKPKYTPEQLFEATPNVIPVVGEFRKTLQDFKVPGPIALVHMDCDLYNSYTEVFTWLAPKLLPGSLIIVDDYYHCKGAEKACNEFMDKYDKEWTDVGKVLFW